MAIADSGQTPYPARTVEEIFFAYQLQTAGYVEIIPVKTHPDYPTLVMAFDVKLTPEGRRYMMAYQVTLRNLSVAPCPDKQANNRPSPRGGKQREAKGSMKTALLGD